MRFGWLTSVLTLLPLKNILRRRFTGRVPPDVRTLATRSWEIAPAESVVARRAFFLDGQLDRVTGWEFVAEHPRAEMEGGSELHHGSTRGYLVKDAFLVDGSLYCQDGLNFLTHRTRSLPRIRVEQEFDHAALFCSPGGNRYFGQWLIDDCTTYELATSLGVPVTTNQPVSDHTRDYESWLGMEPKRVDAAYVRELIVFDDIARNLHKRTRFRALGEKIRARADAKPHPGVFILRGTAGVRRVLTNELALAERLRDQRGLRIIDPMQSDVSSILSACAGSKVIVGVEGSALIHGVLAVAPGAGLMTLQPPNRFVTVYSHLADHLHFGFVVGTPQGEDFQVDASEVERTLDLFPAA